MATFGNPANNTGPGLSAGPAVTPFQQKVINLGWSTPTKTFSAAADYDPATAKELETVLSSAFSSEARTSLVSAKTHCDQWVVVWENRFCMVSATKTFITPVDHFVVGSASDQLGILRPISIPRSRILRDTSWHW